MFIYICACSSYLNKRFLFKTVISGSLPSFNSAHGGTRMGGDMRFSQKHLVCKPVDLLINLSLQPFWVKYFMLIILPRNTDISQLVKFAGSDNSQFVDFQGRTFLSYLFSRVGQFSVRTFVSWLICRAGRQSDIWRIYCYRSIFNVDYTNQLHKCIKQHCN